MNLTEFTVLEVGGLLAAVGCLLVTCRRSLPAAAVGLAGVGLIGLSVVRWPSGLWVNAVELAAGYVLLIWAVLADRPPPAAEE